MIVLPTWHPYAPMTCNVLQLYQHSCDCFFCYRQISRNHPESQLTGTSRNPLIYILVGINLVYCKHVQWLLLLSISNEYCKSSNSWYMLILIIIIVEMFLSHQVPHLPGEGLEFIRVASASSSSFVLLLRATPSTASSRSQWALPDLNGKRQSSVGTAGPQQQAPELSGYCGTSIASARCQIECQIECYKTRDVR